MSRKFKKKQEKREKLPFLFFQKLNWAALDSALLKIKEHDSKWNSHDNFYRIYHRSFKMFRLGSASLSLWEDFFNLFEIKTTESFYDWIETNNRKVERKKDDSIEQQRKNILAEEQARIDHHNERVKNVIKNLKKIGADDLLITQIGMLKDKVFTHASNGNQNKWAKDGAVMAGVFILSKKIIENSLRVLIEWKNNKGLLWTQNSVIEIDDALVMDSLDLLNIRTASKEHIQKVQELVKKINSSS